MSILFLFFVFVFGLSVGSFLNCLIYRLENNKTFLKGRSFCPDCRHTLSWLDLIPVLSFLALRGKCRYCQKRISWQYPLVEIAIAAIFLFIIWNFGFGIFSAVGILSLLFYFLISCFLIIIFVYDLKHYIIPDEIVFPAIFVVFAYQLLKNLWLAGWQVKVENLQLLINPLASAFFASLFFLAIVLMSRGRWMGVGDIKLAFLMGLFLSWPNIFIALFLSFLIGAIIGIGLMIFKKKTLKSELPFGPFLVTGTFIALFFGENIINWYFNLF